MYIQIIIEMIYPDICCTRSQNYLEILE